MNAEDKIEEVSELIQPVGSEPTTDQDSLIAELIKKRKEIAKGGPEDKIKIQRKKGKGTARERIQLLLDEDSFFEIDSYWMHRHHDFEMENNRIPGDSVITGYGKIDGRMVCVYAQDFTVLGGSFSEVQGQKVAKVMDLAMDSGVPVIGLMDSVGARIQEGVYSLAAFSELFWRNTQASGVIPQISIMLGPCAGGSVYSPSLTDFVIMTEGKSHMFLTGPKVIKSVTGEEIDLEALGGARIHTQISGVAHFSAKNEMDAFSLARRLFNYLPLNNSEPPPYIQPSDQPDREDAVLNSVVPSDSNEAYDMHIVIKSIFDRDSFLEVHSDFAQHAMVGFARLHGQAVGVIANQPMVMAGILDIDSSDKIARFVRFCDAFNFPIITMIDTPGFLPGVQQEYSGIIRHGAKIVYAYSEATVPKIAVILRKAYGGAYIVMSSKYIRTDMVYAWPTAEIAVMGAEGAVQILYHKELQTAQNSACDQEMFIQEYREKFTNPYNAASSGHIDDILIPSETRPRLISTLELLRDKNVSSPRKKHGNIPL